MRQVLIVVVWTLVGVSVGLAIGCAGMILAFFLLFAVSGPLTDAAQATLPAALAEPVVALGAGGLCLLAIWYVAGVGAITAVRSYWVSPAVLSLLLVAMVAGSWGLWIRPELLIPAAPADASAGPAPFPAGPDLMPAAAVLGLWLGGRRRPQVTDDSPELDEAPPNP